MDQPVWITGAGGLIGSHLVRAAAVAGRTVRALTRADLDLTARAAVDRAFREAPPAGIIHCAAMSKSVACQQNPGLAWIANLAVTTHLATLAAGLPFIFLSTDMVLDGREGNYDESATPNPLSVYAETKLEAEQFVLGNPRHTVVRTSLTGGRSPTGDRGFNEEMRRAWQAGRALDLFVDEFRCPLPAVASARAIWQLYDRDQPGLYHLAGSQRLSRWEIGQLVATRCPGLAPKMVPGSLLNYAGAPRSPDTSLNCAKIQRLLDFPLPGLADWLAAHPGEYF